MTKKLGEDESPKDGSSPLIKVDSLVNVDLSALQSFKGVAKNALKAVSRGLGMVYAPTDKIRHAKADRLVANEQAQTRIDLTKKAIELAKLKKQFAIEMQHLGSVEARAFVHDFRESIRAQENREKLIDGFAEHVSQRRPEKDTETEIDDDWLTQFWALAEKVSRKEVQSFLARLLAKEVAEPGAISPLTLQRISVLPGKVARTFEHFCRLSIRENKEVFVIHPQVFEFQNIGQMQEYDVAFEDLFEFESYGLLRSAETIMVNYAEGNAREPIDYAGMTGTLDVSGLQLHLLKFARAGAEIRDLLTLTPLPSYTAVLREKLKSALVVPGLD